MSKKTKLIIISIISVLAFFNAFYLSYDWIFNIEQNNSLYFLPMGDFVGNSSFCDINETFSCSVVLSNPLSQIYGIPFPIIALFVYPVIFFIAILGYFRKIKNVFTILFGMGISGIMFNGYFIYQEIFNIGAFCPLCLLCSAIILTISFLSGSEVIKKNIKNKKK